MNKELYLIREKKGYALCNGKPTTCKPYIILGDIVHHYMFGGCDCIQIPETHIKMEIGEEPKKVKIVAPKKNRGIKWMMHISI